jgi:hypothetical protein
VHVAEHQLSQTVRLRREHMQGETVFHSRTSQITAAADLYAGVLSVAPHICVCV